MKRIARDGDVPAVQYHDLIRKPDILEAWLKAHVDFRPVLEWVVREFKKPNIALPWRAYRPLDGGAVEWLDVYGVDIVTPIELDMMIVQSSPMNKVMGWEPGSVE